MPKQRGRRIDSQDLGYQTTKQEGGVYAPTNVKAKQSNINFDAISKFTQAVHQERRNKLDNALYQEGINAANTGEIDPEKQEEEAYARGLNNQSGTNDALKAYAGLERTLSEELKIRKDEGTLAEFDENEFIQEHIKDFQKEGVNSDYLKGFNSRMSNLQANARGLFEKFRAEAEDEQIQFLAQDTAHTRLSLIESGEIPEGYFKQLDKELGDINGLNRDEANAAVYNAVLHAADLGNIQGAKAAADHLLQKSSGVSGQYRAGVEKALAIAEKRKAAEEASEEKRSQEEKFLVMQDLKGTLGNDTFRAESVQNAVSEGYISASQGGSLMDQHGIILEKQRAAAELQAQVNFLKTQPQLLNHITNPKVRTETLKSLDTDYEEVSNSLIAHAKAIDTAVDEQSRAELDSQLGVTLTQAKGLFETSQAAGHTPGAIKRLTDSAIVGSPQFRHTARVVKSLESIEGITPFVGVDTGKLAELRTYNRLSDMGYSPEEAEQVIQDRQETPLPEILSNMRAEGANEFMKDAIDDLTGSQTQVEVPWWFDEKTDINANSYLRSTIKEDAAVFYSKGNDAETSVEMARDRFMETHAAVGGSWVPTKGMPVGFPKAYNSLFEKTFPDKNVNDFVIKPSQDLQGSFMLYRKEDGQPFRRKNGELYVFSYLSMVKAAAEQTQQDAADGFNQAKEDSRLAMEADKRYQESAKELADIEGQLKLYGSNR